MSDTAPKGNLPEELMSDAFAKAMDDFAELVARDDGAVFGSPQERKGSAFALAERRRRNWRKAHICIFPGCKKRTLDSHTIQRGGPLKVISENKHVLVPRFSLTHKEVRMERVGIGEASIFPGFCEVHEQLFSEFEQNGILAQDRHIALQVFRTVCREVVRVQQQIRDLEYSHETYKKAVSAKGVKTLTEALNSLVSPLPSDVKFKDVTLEGVSKAEKIVTQTIADNRETLNMLRADFFSQALNDVNGQPQGLAHFRIDVQQTLPVCLAGFGNFHVQNGAAVEEVFAILNIWPTPAATTITMATPMRYKDALSTYVGTYLNRFLGLVNMLETWMLNGTDHWFIKPSVWDGLPESRKRRILDDIMIGEHSIGKPYPVSIFDELRRDGINLADADQIQDAEQERKKLL